MLVRHNIVLVLGVDRLMVRGHVNVVRGQLVPAKLLQEICVARTMEVDLGVVGILVLFLLVSLGRSVSLMM